MDLCVLRRLVGSGDTGEVWDLPCARLLVEAFWVALLGDLNRDVDEDFDEGDGCVTALGSGGVEVACDGAVGDVGGDEGG